MRKVKFESAPLVIRPFQVFSLRSTNHSAEEFHKVWEGKVSVLSAIPCPNQSS